MIERCIHDYGRSPETGFFTECHACCKVRLTKLEAAVTEAHRNLPRHPEHARNALGAVIAFAPTASVSEEPDDQLAMFEATRASRARANAAVMGEAIPLMKVMQVNGEFENGQGHLCWQGSHEEHAQLRTPFECYECGLEAATREDLDEWSQEWEIPVPADQRTSEPVRPDQTKYVITCDGEPRTDSAKAWPEMPAWADDTDDDKPLPEDAEIKAAFPTRSERHDLYGEAMRLVGARRSKGGLVALVTWLLLRAEHQRTEPPLVGSHALDYQRSREMVGARDDESLREAIKRQRPETPEVGAYARGVRDALETAALVVELEGAEGTKSLAKSLRAMVTGGEGT